MNMNNMMNPMNNMDMMNMMNMMNQMNDMNMMNNMMLNNMNQMQFNPMMNNFGSQIPMNQIDMNKNMINNMNNINQFNSNVENNYENQPKLNIVKLNEGEKIEELIINLHPKVKPKKVYKLKTLKENFLKKGINLYRCSMNLDKKIKMMEHPVLLGYYTAFLEHYPAVISPDILWMLVIEGFSRHVKLNKEKLRHKFVKNHNEKIVITQEANGDKQINTVSSNRWGDIFKDFVEQSKEYVDPTVLHLFTPYFSTTTVEIEYSSQIAIVSIVSPFMKFIKKFKSKGICGACAFPYIKVLGTLQDYKQLKMKIEGLKGYLIDDWIKKIIPIIDKIIETKEGSIDKQFWDNMITNKKRVYTIELSKGESDAEKVPKEEMVEIKIFGWIFDFFPFKNVKRTTKLTEEERLRIYGNGSYTPTLGEYDTLEKNYIETYYDTDFPELPEEMINIDATYRNRRGQTAELGIKTGFLGYSLSEKHEFKPEIGWYFYIKNDPFNLIRKNI